MNTMLSPSRSHDTLAAPDTHADAHVSLDQIFIDGLVAQTVIGIHDHELHRPQPLVIDVQAGLARPRACDTDRIGDTLDYGVLRERLLRLMAEHRVQLLEALAEQMAQIVLHEFGAAWVRVRVAKPRKFDDVQAVGVQIERRREAAVEPAQRGAAVLHVIGSGMVPGSR
ncbi:MAG: dihydroneopterin aldolase [Burkholderiaceae bacterium]